MMEKQNEGNIKVAKSAGVVAFFTAISRVTGLARDMMTSHLFGASGLTDVFYVAFTIPNTLRRFVAEGALTVAFIPVYSDVRTQEGDEKAKIFLSATLGLLLLTLIATVAIGIVAAKYIVVAFASGFADEPYKIQLATTLTRWMFPYVFFISLVALAMGLLNAHQRFGVPAASQIMLNMTMIILPPIAGHYLGQPILILAISVLVGGFFQLLSQIPTLARLHLLVKPSLNFSLKPLRRLLWLMFPSVFGIAVYQINIVIIRQLASYLPEKQITYYYYADRLMQLALGVFAISIATAALPTMSKHTASKDKRALVDTWQFATRLTNFITFPAAAGLFAIAVPIVSVLFLHGEFSWDDVKTTGYTTMAFAPGLLAVAMSRTTVQAFYALEDMRTPVLIGVITLITNLILGFALLRYQIVGLVSAISVSSFIQTLILILWLRVKVGLLGGRKLLASLAQQAGLSLVACLAAYGITLFADWSKGPTLINVLNLSAALVTAILLYGTLALWLNAEEAKPVWLSVKRKLKL